MVEDVLAEVVDGRGINTRPLQYCWTPHEGNRSHVSSQCLTPPTGHQNTATFQNGMNTCSNNCNESVNQVIKIRSRLKPLSIIPPISYVTAKADSGASNHYWYHKILRHYHTSKVILSDPVLNYQIIPLLEQLMLAKSTFIQIDCPQKHRVQAFSLIYRMHH